MALGRPVAVDTPSTRWRSDALVGQTPQDLSAVTPPSAVAPSRGGAGRRRTAAGSSPAAVGMAAAAAVRTRSGLRPALRSDRVAQRVRPAGAPAEVARGGHRAPAARPSPQAPIGLWLAVLAIVGGLVFVVRRAMQDNGHDGGPRPVPRPRPAGRRRAIPVRGGRPSRMDPRPQRGDPRRPGHRRPGPTSRTRPGGCPPSTWPAAPWPGPPRSAPTATTSPILVGDAIIASATGPT